MFLRRNRRRKNGESYEYWTLVESVRTANGPRQRIVANIGKEPGLNEDERYGWEHIGKLLDGQEGCDESQLALFEEEIKAPLPQWAEVNLSSISIERVREFGKVYLSLALWRRLGLKQFFEEHIEQGKGSVSWSDIALLLATGRFCDQSTELALSERWYASTALGDILGIDEDKIYENRLYRGLDKVLPLRKKLFAHLKGRYESWFGTRFEFLLYDITSTYFEGECLRNPQAQRGYSRDKRPDCKQVCIGLVVTPEGLPLAYEVFAGNRADVTTIEDMVELMEKDYGSAERIWVMDRGMVSEDNLEYLQSKQARYIVGTPKSHLKKFEQALLDEADWQEVKSGVEVKLLKHPDGLQTEQYVLCRSRDRQEKESAMLRGQQTRLRKKLEAIDASLRKRPQQADKIERQVGRWLGRNTLAERLFTVTVNLNETKMAVSLTITENPQKSDWVQTTHGSYLLRTNCLDEDPKSLWKWYIQLTQIEDAFRCSKSDLGLRPIYHHREDRVQAHILICFLSLVMWRFLEMWLKSKGLGNCARQLLLELDKIRSMDIVVPLRNNKQARLRIVGKPEKLASDLLRNMGLKIPTRPKILENVVETFS
jgi:transposase